MKNITELKKELLKREAGKKQVNVAQMGEILSHLSDIIVEKKFITVSSILINNGRRRQRDRKRKAKK